MTVPVQIGFAVRPLACSTFSYVRMISLEGGLSTHPETEVRTALKVFALSVWSVAAAGDELGVA
jgi:hypothetical protein